MTEILLALFPLLALLCSLLLGHYPGYRTIVRLAERIGASLPPGRAKKRQFRPRAPLTRAASGGLLIAFGLAQRPPPAAL
jgi:hypothetical protein